MPTAASESDAEGDDAPVQWVPQGKAGIAVFPHHDASAIGGGGGGLTDEAAPQPVLDDFQRRAITRAAAAAGRAADVVTVLQHLHRYRPLFLATGHAAQWCDALRALLAASVKCDVPATMVKAVIAECAGGMSAAVGATLEHAEAVHGFVSDVTDSCADTPACEWAGAARRLRAQHVALVASKRTTTS
jgi:hypothetical protein